MSLNPESSNSYIVLWPTTCRYMPGNRFDGFGFQEWGTKNMGLMWK
jgi:hypothetical protein